MTKRDVAAVALLTIFTCGIYSIYWSIVNNRDAKDSLGFEGPSGGVLLLLAIVTCGIYLIYWRYKFTEHIKGGEEAIIVLVVSLASLIPAIGFVALGITALIMQNMVNEIATE